MPTDKLTQAHATQIKAAFERRALKDYWQVGRIINQTIGQEKHYDTGSLKRIHIQIGRVVSISTLDQCRRLAKHWNEEDIKVAEQAGLPIRHAISLLFFDAQAKKLDQTLKSATAKEIVHKRKALLERIVKSGLKPHDIETEIKKAKNSCFRDMDDGSRQKHIYDVRRFVASNLKRASQRLQDSKGLLTSDEYNKAAAIAVKIDELIERTGKIASG